jgi:hypothetical protein
MYGLERNGQRGVLAEQLLDPFVSLVETHLQRAVRG